MKLNPTGCQKPLLAAVAGSLVLHSALAFLFLPEPSPKRIATQVWTTRQISDPILVLVTPPIERFPAIRENGKLFKYPKSNKSPSNLTEPNTLFQSEHKRNSDLKYLTIDGVDQPAILVGEWVVNTEAWPIPSSTRLEVKVWISSTGILERWELIGDSTNNLMALKGLQPLDETIFNPALLNGVPVASVRMLELIIDRE